MSESAFRVAAGAAHGFGPLQCNECALSVRRALVAAGLHGQVVEIRAASGRDFMICFSYDGGQTTITQNGRHVAIRVGDAVFDNLHPDGLPFDFWLKDFDAVGGVRVNALVDF